MNPATNNNHHIRTEDDCELCGFMKPYSGEDEENTDWISRELPSIAEGDASRTFNPTFRQQEPRRYENQAPSLKIEDLVPFLFQAEGLQRQRRKELTQRIQQATETKMSESRQLRKLLRAVDPSNENHPSL